jgi:DNA-binding NarL/FixJ family response regulator
MTVRVLLADDQALVRAGFKVLVESAPDLASSVRQRPADRPSTWPDRPGPTWC